MALKKKGMQHLCSSQLTQALKFFSRTTPWRPRAKSEAKVNLAAVTEQLQAQSFKESMIEMTEKVHVFNAARKIM